MELQFVAIGGDEKVNLGKMQRGIGFVKARCLRGGGSLFAAPLASRTRSLCQ